MAGIWWEHLINVVVTALVVLISSWCFLGWVWLRVSLWYRRELVIKCSFSICYGKGSACYLGSRPRWWELAWVSMGFYPRELSFIFPGCSFYIHAFGRSLFIKKCSIRYLFFPIIVNVFFLFFFFVLEMLHLSRKKTLWFRVKSFVGLGFLFFEIISLFVCGSMSYLLLCNGFN